MELISYIYKSMSVRLIVVDIGPGCVLVVKGMIHLVHSSVIHPGREITSETRLQYIGEVRPVTAVIKQNTRSN